GRDAVAVYIGNPAAHNLATLLYGRVLIKALGTKNIYSASTVDQMPKQISAGLMFGTILSVPVPDVDRTDHLMILGANPLQSNGSLLTAPDMRGRIRRIRERGGKVVVIDPRRTRTAEHADEHHFIRPGTAMFPRAAAGQPNSLGAPGRGRGVKLGRWTSRVRGLPEAYGELPVVCLAEEIDTPGEGQVRALVTVAGNPTVSTPNAGRLTRAI